VVALCRRLIRLWHQRCELIERAGNRADHVGRDLRVKRRRLQLRMSKQNLDQANIDILLQQMGGKLCRSVCGVTRLLISAMLAAIWTARVSCRVVIGSIGSRPGNNHTLGRAMQYQSRRKSNNRGDSMARRSLRPLPRSMRSSMRLESTSATFRATTSETRRPAL
jgi:hypothetical protein